MHNELLKISSADVYFIADSHFRDARRPEEAERQARFIRFISSIQKDATLFLMGDIFDFYFEQRSVIAKRYFDIYRAIQDCTARGVDVYFMGGNHDYWTHSFFTEDLGVGILPDDVIIECQDRRVRLAHGDNHMPDEGGYKAMRAFMRHPIPIFLARLIHPDIMEALMAWVSSRTKKRKRRTQEEIATYLGDIAPGKFFDRGNDAFIMGHVHYPLHRTSNGRDYVILGDWITRFTYAHLQGGRLSLETFEGVTADAHNL